MIDKNKLKGRIVEKGFSLGQFSERLGMASNTLRRKLNSEKPFTTDEVEKVMKLLDISRSDIVDYFFAHDEYKMYSETIIEPKRHDSR